MENTKKLSVEHSFSRCRTFYEKWSKKGLNFFPFSDRRIKIALKIEKRRTFYKKLEGNGRKKNEKERKRIFFFEKRCKSATWIDFLKFNFETNVHFLGETIIYSFRPIKKLEFAFSLKVKKWKVKFEWKKKYAPITFVQHYYEDRKKILDLSLPWRRIPGKIWSVIGKIFSGRGCVEDRYRVPKKFIVYREIFYRYHTTSWRLRIFFVFGIGRIRVFEVVGG